jgi:hypothetical protein
VFIRGIPFTGCDLLYSGFSGFWCLALKLQLMRLDPTLGYSMPFIHRNVDCSFSYMIFVNGHAYYDTVIWLYMLIAVMLHFQKVLWSLRFVSLATCLTSNSLTVDPSAL